MNPLERMAEARLREAVEQGSFDDLPGADKPLELDDLSHVPDELRAGYMALKSAGCLPEEMALRKDLVQLRDLLEACRDGERAGRLERELTAKTLRYRVLMEKRGSSLAAREYEQRVVRRLEDGKRA